jgi:hypothetical protein
VSGGPSVRDRLDAITRSSGVNNKLAELLYEAYEIGRRDGWNEAEKMRLSAKRKAAPARGGER